MAFPTGPRNLSLRAVGPPQVQWHFSRGTTSGHPLEEQFWAESGPTPLDSSNPASSLLPSPGSAVGAAGGLISQGSLLPRQLLQAWNPSVAEERSPARLPLEKALARAARRPPQSSLSSAGAALITTGLSACSSLSAAVASRGFLWDPALEKAALRSYKRTAAGGFWPCLPTPAPAGSLGASSLWTVDTS